MNSAVEPNRSPFYTYPRQIIEAFDDVSDMAGRPIPLKKGKLRSNNKHNYFNVLLWHTQEDYERAAKVERGATLAVCITDVYVSEDGEARVNPKLGEIHFVSGTWDVNTVAHECQHALLHRLRYLSPGPREVLDELGDDYDQEKEEVIAYEAGSWVEACLVWLTNTDPKSPYPKSVFDR